MTATPKQVLPQRKRHQPVNTSGRGQACDWCGAVRGVYGPWRLGGKVQPYCVAIIEGKE